MHLIEKGRCWTLYAFSAIENEHHSLANARPAANFMSSELSCDETVDLSISKKTIAKSSDISDKQPAAK